MAAQIRKLLDVVATVTRSLYERTPATEVLGAGTEDWATLDPVKHAAAFLDWWRLYAKPEPADAAYFRRNYVAWCQFDEVKPLPAAVLDAELARRGFAPDLAGCITIRPEDCDNAVSAAVLEFLHREPGREFSNEHIAAAVGYHPGSVSRVSSRLHAIGQMRRRREGRKMYSSVKPVALRKRA